MRKVFKVINQEKYILGCSNKREAVIEAFKHGWANLEEVERYPVETCPEAISRAEKPKINPDQCNICPMYEKCDLRDAWVCPIRIIIR